MLTQLTNVVFVPPLETDSQVVRVEYPSLEESKKLFGLLGVELIDVFRERSNGIDAFPSCDRVGPYDRMHCRQMSANILRCTTRSFVDNDMLGIGCSSF